jgi:hypothetical protein
VTENAIFRYKYLLIENGTPKLWEMSEDRVADLNLLEPVDQSVLLHDTWEEYCLQLEIASPSQNLWVDGLTPQPLKMQMKDGKFTSNL